MDVKNLIMKMFQISITKIGEIAAGTKGEDTKIRRDMVEIMKVMLSLQEIVSKWDVDTTDLHSLMNAHLAICIASLCEIISSYPDRIVIAQELLIAFATSDEAKILKVPLSPMDKIQPVNGTIH